MNARQRALAALAGQEVWPVPHDLFCNGVYPDLENRLARHYGLAEGGFEALLRATGSHTRWGTPRYIGPALPERGYEGTMIQPQKKLVRNIWGTWDGLETYFDGIERPLQQAQSPAEIDAYPWPDPDWFDYGTLVWETFSWRLELPVAEWSARHADCLRVAGPAWMPLFSRIMDLCGMETALLNMLVNPELTRAMIERIGGFMEAYTRRLARAVQGHADVLRFGDDFSTQRGPMIDPGLWRDYFLPTWRRLFAIAHEHGMCVQMHSCGAVRPVLGDLVDAGLDIFETVQINAVGMEPEALKRDFGDRLTFYGGIDVQQLLPYGSPDEVRSEVRRLAAIFGRGGRYILSTAHTMGDEIPVENAVAMFEEAAGWAPD